MFSCALRVGEPSCPCRNLDSGSLENGRRNSQTTIVLLLLLLMIAIMVVVILLLPIIMIIVNAFIIPPYGSEGWGILESPCPGLGVSVCPHFVQKISSEPLSLS